MTTRRYRDPTGVVHDAADNHYVPDYGGMRFTLCERMPDEPGRFRSDELAPADLEVTTCVTCLGTPEELRRVWPL